MPLRLADEQLIQLAEQYDTPLYVYYAERIKEQYERLTKAFSNSDVKFFYASKALTNINILKYIKSIGCNIDCSSVNEVKLAIKAGFAPQNILYTSSSIAFSEIEEVKDLGVNINIDSLSNLEKFGKKFGHSYPVGIRLRPNIMAGGNLKISTGHNKSKFGIPVEQIDKILELVKKYDLFIRVLHIHTGSDIEDADVFVKGIEVIFDLIPNFNELECIDLGGGFKVPYKKEDKGVNIELLAQKVKTAFDNHPNPGGKHLQIWFEPGKFLVSESGYFITKVNVIKAANGVTYAGVNSGLNHLLRPMFYGAYHTIKNISNPNGPVKNYNVVGNICETDTFAEDRPLPEIREEDLLVFLNAGAYGFEMSSNYNSRYKPAEVMVKDGQSFLIRKRDELDDLLKNQVEVL